MRSFGLSGLLAALWIAGCGDLGGGLSESISEDESEIRDSSPLTAVFDRAADKWNVPADLLKAIAYNQTQIEPATGAVEFEGQPAPYGYFGLAGDELARAALLSGRSVEDVIGDDDAGIEAAAALLDAYASEVGLRADGRADVEAWEPAIAKLGNYDKEGAQDLVREILEHLAGGVAVPMFDGTTMIIRRHPELLSRVELDGAFATSGEGLGQSGALWRPSPNHNSRNGSGVDMVVIHTCEGPYSGCVSWLRNTAASASAHYVVKENGAEISQLVDENRRAWHVAASYRPSLNSNKLTGRSGQSVNTFSVGIEHGGRASQRTWPTAQINKSVQLVRGIASRHRIPRDRYHIVGHGRLQPENRTDPGPNWPWTSYIASIAASSGSGSGTGTGTGSGTGTPTSMITVDNTTTGRFRASANWETSAWASGRVGTNYRYRSPAATSDTAEYKVDINTAGRYEVFARVPGNGYSTDIPYVITHQGGETIVHRNVSARGATWVSLGTYDFAARDEWIVRISCWTGGEGYVIADAIKLERR